MIEINKVPVQIGTVWYYEKINCGINERYISVENYKTKFGKGYVDNKNSMKSIVAYDVIKNTNQSFKSFKDAEKGTGVNRTSIWESLHTPYHKLIKKRYRFSLNEIEIKKDVWEYSNKQFI